MEGETFPRGVSAGLDWLLAEEGGGSKVLSSFWLVHLTGRDVVSRGNRVGGQIW